jgi:4-hydroxy-3-methylbut-2-enyl diphosphate reductase
MKIIRADVLGYCFGVRRAVEKAKTARKDFADSRVYTWGPLIHNPTALAMLEREGIGALPENSPASSIPGDSVVVIRAHGIPPEEREKLSAFRAVDASCPHVLANQRQAAELSRGGFFVIIAGDGKHGETLAVAGCAERRAIVENRAQAERFAKEYAKSGCLKPALLAQTTISRAEFDAIAAALKPTFPDIVIRDTICPETLERQNALDRLCRRVDGVLVIGGKHSANTARLFSLARTLCQTPRVRVGTCALIENETEIPAEFFSLDTVGLTAGASTPDEVIAAVEQRLTERAL